MSRVAAAVLYTNRISPRPPARLIPHPQPTCSSATIPKTKTFT
ncbi:hypothetical protein FOXYSP1_08968 [Fusarium oxysporum f. sp. phaseoli]